MKKRNRILGTMVFILLICFGCEKEELNNISIDCKLVDEFGDQISQISMEDSIFFEFYISNFSGEVATYLRPCGEFGDFLNIFQEVPGGDYKYYGRPVYNCPAIAIWDSIFDGETQLVTKMPWIEELGWPEREPGIYYVGDTLSLKVNDELIKAYKRIYFEIE